MSDVLIDRPELDGLGVYEFGWHDADAAGLDVPGPKDEFLDNGRITLAAPDDAEGDR